MILDVLGNAKQGWNDLKNIVAPITSTIKVGFSTAGVIKLSEAEENELIEQLMIEELLKQQSSIQEPSIPTIALPRQSLSKTDTLYHLPRLKKNSLQYVLGQGENGELIIQDLAQDKHLLVAGATGSGKSVTLFNILVCLTAINTPKMLKISLIDPKILSFGDNRIVNSPFLTMPPSVGDNKTAYKVLLNAYSDMMKRYQVLREAGVKDYKKINIPAHVIFIDEVYELISGELSKEIITLITKIASLGRQAGVHLVMATQSPRAEILSGALKANLKVIGHKVENITESKILGINQAHLLSGAGEGYKNINGEAIKFQATFIDIDSNYIYQYIAPNTPNIPPQTTQHATPPKQPNMQTQTAVNMGLSGGIEINMNTQTSHKKLIDKILSSADDNQKIAPKKQLININSGVERKEFDKAIKELLQLNKIYFVNGKGYYIRGEL